LGITHLQVVIALHRIREQALEPDAIFGLGLRQIFHARLEVFAIRIHGAHHHFIAEHNPKYFSKERREEDVCWGKVRSDAFRHFR
jgi:hypothetical protein